MKIRHFWLTARLLSLVMERVTARSVTCYSFAFTSLHSENQANTPIYIMGEEADETVLSFRLTSTEANTVSCRER